jgi:hypothetical protein
MELSEVKAGLRVKVVFVGPTKGMIVHPAHLRARHIGACGKVTGIVPGHGGDVWWVSQDDGQVGAYCFDEFEPE